MCCNRWALTLSFSCMVLGLRFLLQMGLEPVQFSHCMHMFGCVSAHMCLCMYVVGARTFVASMHMCARVHSCACVYMWGALLP